MDIEKKSIKVNTGANDEPHNESVRTIISVNAPSPSETIDLAESSSNQSESEFSSGSESSDQSGPQQNYEKKESKNWEIANVEDLSSWSTLV